MTDTIEAQQRVMWDAYTAHEYEKALAIALALGPKQDNGLRSLLEHHVQREQARAKAQRDVDTLPESDAGTSCRAPGCSSSRRQERPAARLLPSPRHGMASSSIRRMPC